MNRKSIATYAWGSLALAASLLGAAVPLHAADYKLIYGFQGGSDGQWPKGRLAQLGTDLFGATLTGGNPCNCGTIYRLTQSGQETVIHSFTGAPADGAAPEGGLAVLGTTLYGTTSAGGANQTCFNDTECGTVFRIEPNGSEKIIHNSRRARLSPQTPTSLQRVTLFGARPRLVPGPAAQCPVAYSGPARRATLSASV